MHTLTTLDGVWRERGGTGGTRRDEMGVYFIIKPYYVHV